MLSCDPKIGVTNIGKNLSAGVTGIGATNAVMSSEVGALLGVSLAILFSPISMRELLTKGSFDVSRLLCAADCDRRLLTSII